MARKKHGAEQIVAILRQIEVELANHKTTGQACKEAGITEQTYYRWRKEYGGLKLDQAKRLKELERENSRLRLLVTELSLEYAEPAPRIALGFQGEPIRVARRRRVTGPGDDRKGPQKNRIDTNISR
jgi:putative transposase